ncbi:MAG: hypothetical protein WCK13_08630 [Ignavibacteriota bacterium]|nr:hypothetical protein [Ignavibacteriota bacterium]
MKTIIYSFYMVSVFMIAVALLGGSLTRPLVDGYSMKTIQTIGIDKAKIDTMDVLIDNSIYNMNLMMYKIEKLKNTLTLQDDNTKPIDFRNYKYLYNSVYMPIVSAVSYVMRIVIGFTGIFILMLTALVHSISSYLSLRKRVTVLEQKLGIQKQ